MARGKGNVHSHMALLYSKNNLCRGMNFNKLPLPSNIQEKINFGIRKLISSFSAVPVLLGGVRDIG